MFRANCYPRWHLTPTINSHNGAVWSIVFGVVTLLYEERKIGLKAHRHICAAALSIKGHSAVANDQLVCGDAHRIAAYERSCPIINHTYDNTWWVYFWTYTVLSICLIRHIYGVLVSHHQLHIDANEVTVRTNDASAPLSIINVAQALIYTLYSKDKQRQQQQQQSGRKKLFIAYASGHRSNRHRASPPWHGFINWIKLITSLVCVCVHWIGNSLFVGRVFSSRCSNRNTTRLMRRQNRQSIMFHLVVVVIVVAVVVFGLLRPALVVAGVGTDDNVATLHFCISLLIYAQPRISVCVCIYSIGIASIWNSVKQ